MGKTAVSSNMSKRNRSKAKGIFCLEGDWHNDLNLSSSVRPVLDLVCQNGAKLKYIYRDVATRPEFEHYLQKWTQRRWEGFPVLYLAFHGETGCIYVGDYRSRESKVTLDELAELLEGRCKGRLVHFGSCDTVRIDKRHIKRFLRRTEALAVTGFAENVDWLRTAAFEILFFDELQNKAFTKRGMQSVHNRIRKEMPQLVREHRFEMVVRE